jgi:hypothetical protein
MKTNSKLRTISPILLFLFLFLIPINKARANPVWVPPLQINIKIYSNGQPYKYFTELELRCTHVREIGNLTNSTNRSIYTYCISECIIIDERNISGDKCDLAVKPYNGQKYVITDFIPPNYYNNNKYSFISAIIYVDTKTYEISSKALYSDKKFEKPLIIYFIIAIIIVVIIENIIVILFMHRQIQSKILTIIRIISMVSIINLFTIVLAWTLLQILPLDIVLKIVTIEGLVIIIEILFYKKIFSISFTKAGMISITANIISYICGEVIFRLY